MPGTAALDVSKFWADVDALAAATAGPMRAALLGESAALPAAALWPEPISERAQHGALKRCQPLNGTSFCRPLVLVATNSGQRLLPPALYCRAISCAVSHRARVLSSARVADCVSQHRSALRRLPACTILVRWGMRSSAD